MSVELAPEVTPKVWDIFEPTHDGTFNACVGENSLHDLRTYADGYIEASVLLLDTILEQRLIGQMDTLVHPILYSARHAIELTIKAVLFELNSCDLKTEEKLITGHSLSKLWAFFDVVAQKDSRLKELYLAIDPILKALDAADPDAQDFRYPTGNAQDGVAPTQTLQGKAIVDLLTVRKMVKELEDLLESLHLMAEIVACQRCLGTYTQDLNRDELMQLAIDCGSDPSSYFCDTQVKWQQSHGLSKRAFRRATDFIKDHREFSGYTGNETPLIAIAPDLLDAIVEFKLEDVERMLVRQKERRDKKSAGSSFYVFDVGMFAEEAKEEPIKFKAYSALKSQLTAEVVAELEALFYLSYPSGYSENYLSDYENKLANLSFADAKVKEYECMCGFLHIFSKVNMLDNLIKSLSLVGQNTKSESYLGKLESLKRSLEINH
ncbi:hypothetical protein ACFJ92_003476 [Vibrio parahaemolyticus]|nr:hypothetical protein [Vibrio parahaemolyticus]MBE3739446.1 hypothetical protein [Vibrio parahaemolyticus]